MSFVKIDAQTASAWLENGEAQIIDVREPAEYRAEHIAGAKNLPMTEVKIDGLPLNTDKKYVLHCNKGGRGTRVCTALVQQNPALVIYHLEGGIQAWKAAGLATQQGNVAFLPLDRQVQLTIGLSLLVGSVLAYMISPIWLLLTGFLGAGLTFAGLTGFCGLALLMAKMPWNK